MLRVPQHERKKINGINSFPFVLSAVEGLLRVFQQPPRDCGVASFRLSTDELSSWLFGFGAIYSVSIIDLHGLRTHDGEAWWSIFVAEVAANIAKKMTFGDAVLLREGENYNAEAIVTWNTKDFARRTRLTVLTPTGFLRSH
jgi:hypothetical protein